MKFKNILISVFSSALLLSGCAFLLPNGTKNCEVTEEYEYNEYYHWHKTIDDGDCYPYHESSLHEFGDEVVEVEGDFFTDRKTHVECKVCHYRVETITPCTYSKIEPEMSFTLVENSGNPYYIISRYDYPEKLEKYGDTLYLPIEYKGVPIKGIDHLSSTWLDKEYRVIIPNEYEIIGPHFMAQGYSGARRGFIYVPKTIVEINNGAFSNYGGVIYTNFENDEEAALVFEHLFSFNKICYNVPSDYEPIILDNIEYELHVDHTARVIDAVVSQFDEVHVDDSINHNGTYMVTEFGTRAFFETKYVGALPSGLKVFGRESMARTLIKDNAPLILPSGVTKISERAFVDSRIKKIVCNENLATIGHEAFYISDLEDFELPESLKYVGADAFDGSKVTSFVIPEGLETAYAGAFDSATNVTYKARNLDLITQGSVSLFGYKSLESIVFTDTVEHVPANICFICDNLTTVTFSDSIKSIGSYAFYKVPITTIVLPESLEYIYENAFCETSLNGVFALPNTLKFIGYCAFANCNDIDYFTYDGFKYDFLRIAEEGWNQDNTGWFDRLIDVECNDGWAYFQE